MSASKYLGPYFRIFFIHWYYCYQYFLQIVLICLFCFLHQSIDPSPVSNTPLKVQFTWIYGRQIEAGGSL